MLDAASDQGEVDTDGPVVETTAGRVKGVRFGPTARFLGIPYGAPVGVAARFQPPSPAAPWAGVRHALVPGGAAPQAPRDRTDERRAAEEAFLSGFQNGPQGEDCLHLNIWSQTPLEAARRPVLVWLHGGHFSSGSAHEQAAYDGTNLSRRGDVVVVSVNHRLNVLGFLDLSAFGERYARSGTVGMLDLVLALGWIRDNIARFGGDPDCVTIFGQSGGGAKVAALMAMPSARGLFHRAIMQSNCALRLTPRETARRLADAVLDELGLGPRDVDRLHDVPYAALSVAERAAVARLCPPANPARRNHRIRWEPSVGGEDLPVHPFEPEALALSADIPLLVGTTLNEFTSGIGLTDCDAMDEAAFDSALAASFGDTAAEVARVMRERYPHAIPFDRLSRAYGATIRACAVLQATRKAAQGAAPAFLYWFTWQTPVLGRRPRAYHNAELPFVFANSDRCATATGGGAAARRLAGQMADAWIAFARSGDPGHADLPAWPRFDARSVPTLRFDDPCLLELDPDGAERAVAGLA